MLAYSELYPVNNERRLAMSLDGLWEFCLDPRSEGVSANWAAGLPREQSVSMPVPSSYNDLFTDKESRDYCGDYWYQTQFYVPEGHAGKRVYVRFGSITHRAHVYCNGVLVGEHEGGFLPVVCDVTEAVLYGQSNRLVVCANNELSDTSLPCGLVRELPDGRRINKPFFDFFNYSGIHRSVVLQLIPEHCIEDYAVTFELQGKDAVVHYQVTASDAAAIAVTLTDREGQVVATAAGAAGDLHVADAHLWQVRNAYLYTIDIVLKDGETVLDHYTDRIGIRTVKVEGERILLNGEPVYLKGFGRHEDFHVIGRGFSYPVMKRDYECMKWIGANCFRTSHYPYAEEWYRMADEEGFLVIDEVPAVGMLPSLTNFAAAADKGKKATYFFERETTPILLARHKAAVEEMIARDKNHPCVIAWSLFNEPESTTDCARTYFAEVFETARALDPQHRPMTGALEVSGSPESCQIDSLCDLVCVNRYYGWYIEGGSDLPEAQAQFIREMEGWKAKGMNKPLIFTEFGADTLGSLHKLPSVMWSQEYQNEYLAMNFDIFDRYEFVQGELVWNYADFQTVEGIMRVDGNKKGIFTRDRQPKDAAYVFRNRWTAQDR